MAYFTVSSHASQEGIAIAIDVRKSDRPNSKPRIWLTLGDGICALAISIAEAEALRASLARVIEEAKALR
jgi:hypothetical protein